MADDSYPAPSGDDRMLAAEYALGVLEGPAREMAARRVERERDFALAVDGWHAQLMPLLDEVEGVEPPARVWRAIEGTLGRADAVPVRSVASVRDAADPIIRQAIPAWRAFLLMVMGGAVASFALLTLVDRGFVDVGAPSGDTDLGPALVATLTPDGSAPPALARLDPSGTLTVRIAVASEEARVPELWLIPGDGVPRSLGLLPDGGRAEGITIALPGGIVPASGEALAVSLEPPGGSPTGAPTGPVIASGQLVLL